MLKKINKERTWICITWPLQIYASLASEWPNFYLLFFFKSLLFEMGLKPLFLVLSWIYPLVRGSDYHCQMVFGGLLISHYIRLYSYTCNLTKLIYSELIHSYFRILSASSTCSIWKWTKPFSNVLLFLNQLYLKVKACLFWPSRPLNATLA